MRDQQMAERAYAVDAPYPNVRVRCANKFYARMMLDNVGGIHSEMSAVGSYFYYALIGEDYGQISEVFHRISIVEMHHLDIFASLAMQLGEDPRLWTQKGNGKVYWSPSYLAYPCRMGNMLHDAIQAEKQTVQKYSEQARIIRDEQVCEILYRVIEDERLHIDILCDLQEEYLRTPDMMR